MPHLHLCNRAGFRDNAAKLGKPGHNRDIGPKTGTVPAKNRDCPGQTGTLGNYDSRKYWRALNLAVEPEIENIGGFKFGGSVRDRHTYILVCE